MGLKMSIYQLPVSNLPNQSFDTTIPNKNGDNITWYFRLVWNLCTETWEISIAKNNETNYVALNIPVITSDNLLEYMMYKEDLGKIIVMNSGKSLVEKPNTENLGSDYLILWDNLDGESTVDTGL